MVVLQRVLLVDDDELTLQMLEASLEGRYELSTAPDGLQALALIEAQPFDLVLLDVDMPGIDGYETCRRLKAMAQGMSLPVVFLSARTSIEERLLGYEVGGEDYLAKPFDVTELQTKLALVLAKRSKELELNSQLDEVMNAVLSSADMVGEAGVVLEFQRQLHACDSLAAVSQAMFEALHRYGLDGCLRLTGRHGSHCQNARGPSTALEVSLLDHLQAQAEGQRIRSVGPHTGFNYGSVLMFVRNLRMDRTGMDAAESERMGRHIDNVALLVEGAVSRVAALDTELTARDLAEIQHLMTMTRQALSDISARSQHQRQQVQHSLESLRLDVEESFLRLGLTAAQEDLLSSIIKQHSEDALKVLADDAQVEGFLQKVIAKLARST